MLTVFQELYLNAIVYKNNPGLISDLRVEKTALEKRLGKDISINRVTLFKFYGLNDLATILLLRQMECKRPLKHYILILLRNYDIVNLKKFWTLLKPFHHLILRPEFPRLIDDDLIVQICDFETSVSITTRVTRSVKTLRLVLYLWTLPHEFPIPNLELLDHLQLKHLTYTELSQRTDLDYLNHIVMAKEIEPAIKLALITKSISIYTLLLTECFQ